ncbi:hypothetical protein [Cohnella thailandensis]|uniref:Uncharacterized protein n=1 Tax=Cohnella thailandensis TaxID=557557 RepID=A0A841SP83_9BACL|nr:hypothetical protein [Cohnella thailandensis]MBB6633764.1 hypothetical protein [Cohnella thailandensis]MBP1976553.1 hypothetical protein [Cohnella thailandensis]
MAFIMFIAASMLEYISFFIFVMVLFRFSVKENILRFILGALILAFVSNTLQTESLQDISPIVNVFILFFLTTIILRVRLFHAFIMVVMGYVTQALVQWLLYMILINSNAVDEFVPYTASGYALQLLTFFFVCLISGFIYLSKGGFGYIQSSSRFYKDSIKGNKLFLIFLVLGLIILFAVNVLYMTNSRMIDSISVVAISLIAILLVLIYFSIRKER